MTIYLFFQNLHWLTVYPSLDRGGNFSGDFVAKVAMHLTPDQVKYVLGIRNIVLPWTNPWT